MVGVELARMEYTHEKYTHVIAFEFKNLDAKRPGCSVLSEVHFEACISVTVPGATR